MNNQAKRGSADATRTTPRTCAALAAMATVFAGVFIAGGTAHAQNAVAPNRERVALVISISEYDGAPSDDEYDAEFRTVPNDLNAIRVAVQEHAEPTSNWQLEGGRVEVDEMNALIDNFIQDLLNRDDEDPKPIAFIYYSGLTAHGASGDNLLVPSNAFQAQNGTPYADRMVRLERLLWVLREHTYATLFVIDGAYPAPRGRNSTRNTSVSGFGFTTDDQRDLTGGADAPTNDNVMMVFLGDPTDYVNQGDRSQWPTAEDAPNCSAFAFAVARLIRSNQVVASQFPDFLRDALEASGGDFEITESEFEEDLFDYYITRPSDWAAEMERYVAAVEEERDASDGTGPLFRRALRRVVDLDHGHPFAFELAERFEQDALYEEALLTYQNLIEAGQILGEHDVVRAATEAAEALQEDVLYREGEMLEAEDDLRELCQQD